MTTPSTSSGRSAMATSAVVRKGGHLQRRHICQSKAATWSAGGTCGAAGTSPAGSRGLRGPPLGPGVIASGLTRTGTGRDSVLAPPFAGAHVTRRGYVRSGRHRPSRQQGPTRPAPRSWRRCFGAGVHRIRTRFGDGIAVRGRTQGELIGDATSSESAWAATRTGAQSRERTSSASFRYNVAPPYPPWMHRAAGRRSGALLVHLGGDPNLGVIISLSDPWPTRRS